MKKLSYFWLMAIALVSVTVMSACNDDDDVPVNAKITAAIAAEVPNGRITEVERIATGYEVDVVSGTTKYEVYLNTAYQWLRTEKNLLWSEVPDAVKTALSNDGYTFNTREDDADLVTVPAGNTRISYVLIELDREPRDIVLRYMEDGTPYTAKD